MRAYVYNPSDSPTSFLHASIEYTLAPNAVTELKPQGDATADLVLAHCLRELGSIGVVACDSARPSATLVDEAEAKHSLYLLQRHGPAVEEAKRRQALGFNITREEEALLEQFKDWELLKK